MKNCRKEYLPQLIRYRTCNLQVTRQICYLLNYLARPKLTLSQTTNFQNYDENGRKFSERIENSGGKGEIARYEKFLHFLQSFQKTSSADILLWKILQEKEKFLVISNFSVSHNVFYPIWLLLAHLSTKC